MLESTFDARLAQVKITGGTGKFVLLRCDSNKKLNDNDDDDDEILSHANDVLALDVDEFENTATDSTKALVLNTFSRGKMLSREKLHQIANMLYEHPRIVATADEVSHICAFRLQQCFLTCC